MSSYFGITLFPFPFDLETIASFLGTATFFAGFALFGAGSAPFFFVAGFPVAGAFVLTALATAVLSFVVEAIIRKQFYGMEQQEPFNRPLMEFHMKLSIHS